VALHRSRLDPVGRPLAAEEEHRPAHAWHLGTGTLACPACDAPVALTAPSMSVTDALACPYCGRAGRLRDFLSLEPPPRPARVRLTVVERYADAGSRRRGR